MDAPTNQQQLGELSATIGYLEPSSFIEVKVLAAKDVWVERCERLCKWFHYGKWIYCDNILNETGFKPYVELQLLPAVLFEDDPKQLQRTSIHKQQTHDPQFGETFQM